MYIKKFFTVYKNKCNVSYYNEFFFFSFLCSVVAKTPLMGVIANVPRLLTFMIIW